MARRIINLSLAPEETEVLTRLAKRLGTSQSQLLRWALRHYALTGPWHRPGTETREEVIGVSGPLDVGPNYVEAI